MTKYRKKPVVIEAFEWTQKLHDEYWFSEDGTDDVPGWFDEAMHANTVMLQDGFTTIITLEGDHRASIGDFIIQGVKGEIYPCKPDIFAATYELAEA